MEVELIRENSNREGRWKLNEADWDKFQDFSEDMLRFVRTGQSMGGLCNVISGTTLFAASESIQRSKSGKNK